MSATYDIGDSAKLTFTVTVSGVLTNATVALSVTDPAGTVTTPSVTNASTGVYTATLAFNAAGVWLYRWTATGAATTAEDGQLLVEVNATGDLYATVSELQARFGIPAGTDNELLEKAIRSASRSIDKTAGRRFTKDTAATARVFYPDGCYHVDVDDFHTTTGLVVATDDGADGTYATTWAAAHYQVSPLNGVVDGESGWPYSRITSVNGLLVPSRWGAPRRAPIQVTAKWGWAAIPAGVREACLITAAELARLKDAPFGVVSYGDFGPIRIRDNPVVMRHLAPYVRTQILMA